MAAFPENIACVINNGFGETLPYMKKYLGNTENEAYRDRGVCKVSVHIGSHADMDTFTQWYKNYGHKAFTINLPLYGVEKAWLVRIIDALSTQAWSKSASVRTIQMKLEVLDTI